MDVAEFFVLRGIRGKGIGRSAAHALFRTCSPGVGGPSEADERRRDAVLVPGSRELGGQPVASSPFSIEGTDWDLLRFATGSERIGDADRRRRTRRRTSHGV